MTEQEKTNGYKFTITFLVAVGSILCTIFNQLQNRPIFEDLYLLVCGFISTLIIIILGFIFYFLIKGFSMEIQDNSHVKHLNQIATNIYLANFILFNFLILSTTIIFLLKFNLISILIYILGVIIIIYVYILPLLKNKSSATFEELKSEPSMKKRRFYWIYLAFLRLKMHKVNFYALQKLNALFFIGFLIWLIIFLCIVSMPIGNITIQMQNIYHKNDTFIPVSIQVTGLNSELSVSLLKVESDNFSPKIITGFLKSKCNIKKVIFEESLVVNSQGQYNVFINTSSLTPGYYELLCAREKYIRTTYDKKGFYLLNNS